jgi:DNA-directed RNA polymerase specialized sigma24 family protein
MQDAQIVNALRTRSPDSVAELFDAYGEQLFQYCWLLLLRRDAAATAVRDAMITARANIATLRSPEELAPWLCALARAECQRHDPAPAAEADVPLGDPGQPVTDSQLVAWRAVLGVAPAEREALDLTARHAMSTADVALVTGLSTVEADFLVTQAQASLQRALTAELARGRGNSGGSAQAGAAAPRVVSASKVFGRLPSPATPSGMRDEVLAAAHDAGDVRDAGAAGDVRHVRDEDVQALAAPSVSAFDPAGFPLAPVRSPDSALDAILAAPRGAAATRSGTHSRAPGSRQLLAGLIAAGIAAAAVGVLWITGLSLPDGTRSAYQASAPVSTPQSGDLSSSAAVAPGQVPGPGLSPRPSTRRSGHQHTRADGVFQPRVGARFGDQELYLMATQPPRAPAGALPAPAPPASVEPTRSGPAPTPIWSTPVEPPSRSSPPNPGSSNSPTPTATASSGSSSPTAPTTTAAPTTPAPSSPAPTPPGSDPTSTSAPSSGTPSPDSSPSPSASGSASASPSAMPS